MNLLSCQHLEIFNRNCLECGIYVYKEMNITGLKSQLYSEMGRTARSLKSIKKNQNNFLRRKPNFVLKAEIKEVFNLLMSRLMVSKQTYALAIYLLETNAERLLENTDFSQEVYTKFIAASCFLLAMKTLEIKYKVPQIPDLKRILRIQIDKKQIGRIEMDILMNNKPSTTFLDFINVYLVNGGVFSFQNIRQPEIFESKLSEFCWQYIKNGSFLNYDQEELAVYLLYKTRKEFKFPQIWNWHIEYYTQISLSKVLQIVKQFETKQSPSKIMQVNKNLNNMQTGSSCILTSENRRNYILNIEESLEKIRKSYNKIRKDILSPIPRLHSVKSGSSINKHCFRVQ